MHAVRRGDNLLTLGAGASVSYDFEIVVPLARGGEVIMGRRVNLFISSLDNALTVTKLYSHDFGATFVDSGTTDAVPAGGVLELRPIVFGTNIRITVTDDGLGSTIDSALYLT